MFNILDPKALATCDVIISATKPNNDDEPFDINALASCILSILAVPIFCKLFIYSLSNVKLACSIGLYSIIVAN